MTDQCVRGFKRQVATQNVVVCHSTIQPKCVAAQPKQRGWLDYAAIFNNLHRRVSKEIEIYLFSCYLSKIFTVSLTQKDLWSFILAIKN